MVELKFDVKNVSKFDMLVTIKFFKKIGLQALPRLTSIVYSRLFLCSCPVPNLNGTFFATLKLLIFSDIQLVRLQSSNRRVSFDNFQQGILQIVPSSDV